MLAANLLWAGVIPAQANRLHARPARSPAAVTATFTVTKTDDTADGDCDDDCSLREAILAANAAPGPDLISLPAGTYVLSLAGAGEGLAATGDLDLNDDVTISGALSSTTLISTTGLAFRDRIFEITTTVAATIENVTLTGVVAPLETDLYGGGIYNHGNLTLRDSQVINNVAVYAGGITSGGSLAVAEIIRSVIASNTAWGAGGVGNSGVMTISDSLIANNVATNSVTFAGGMHSSGRLYVISSTVAGNTAYYGGGLANAGTATVSAVTFTGNEAFGGGAVWNYLEGQVTLDQVDIVSNTAAHGAGILNNDPASVLTVTQSTLRENAAAGLGGGFFGFGHSTIMDSAVLSNTADYGAGLYISVTAVTLITNTTIASNTATTYGGGIYNGLGVNEGAVSPNLALSSTVVQSNTAGVAGGGVFNVGALDIFDSDLLSNTANLGGGLYNAVDLEPFFTSGPISATTWVRQSRIAGNSATESGGGLYAGGGLVHLTDGSVLSNTARDFGAGLYLTGTTSFITNTLVSGNVVSGLTGIGGGAVNLVGTLSIDSSTISHNSAPYFGGGGFMNQGTLRLFDSQVISNSAMGGAVCGITIAAHRVCRARPAWRLCAVSSPATWAGSRPDSRIRMVW